MKNDFLFPVHRGTESRLIYCDIGEWGIEKCDYEQDVGVICGT